MEHETHVADRERRGINEATGARGKQSGSCALRAFGGMALATVAFLAMFLVR